MGKRKKRAGCDTCVYRGYAAGQVICEYILHTKKRRPCPAGPECTEYQKEGEVPRQRPRDLDPDYVWSDETMKTRTWDTERARRLVEEGYSNLEIAEMVGTTKEAVALWKSRAGLAAKKAAKVKEPAATESERPEKAEVQRKEEPAREVEMPPLPEPAARERADKPGPGVKGLKLCITLDGCEVEIWSDSAAAAAAGCRLALDMLGGLADEGA